MNERFATLQPQNPPTIHISELRKMSFHEALKLRSYSARLPRKRDDAVLPSATFKASDCPTSPFTILEPQNPWIDEFYVVQKRRATDFKAPKLWKGSSGGE